MQGILGTNYYEYDIRSRRKDPYREHKWFDSTDAATVLGVTGTVLQNNLVPIPQGTTESQRIGRKIIVTNVNLRAHFQLPHNLTTTDGEEGTIRFTIYLDKQCNGVGATPVTLWGGAGRTFLTHQNLSESDRITFLVDEQFNITSQAAIFDTGGFGAASYANGMFVEFDIACNIPIYYDDSATSGTIGSITSNIIGVMGMSKNGIPTSQHECRIRYLDS